MSPTSPSPVNISTASLYTYSSLTNVLQYIVLLSFASLPFISLPLSLFCSSDCDELSHLKCFLSVCIPGGFQSPSIFPCPPHPTTTDSLHFLRTHLSILYLSAVVLCFSYSSLYSCLPLTISASIPILYSESITQIPIMLSDRFPTPTPTTTLH